MNAQDWIAILTGDLATLCLIFLTYALLIIAVPIVGIAAWVMVREELIDPVRERLQERASSKSAPSGLEKLIGDGQARLRKPGQSPPVRR